MVEAIAAPKKTARLARMNPPEGDLSQVLHLAEMLMQLVGQRRLGVLPDLLEAGKLYRGMTKTKLASLVEGLQTHVDQLADVLSLELSEERDYVKMLIDAQRQMAAIGEQIAGESASAKDDEAYNQLLAHTNELTDAMQQFLTADVNAAKGHKRWAGRHAAHEDGAAPRGDAGHAENISGAPALIQKLTRAANRCRERRHELSLLLVEPNAFHSAMGPQAALAGEEARRAIYHACAVLESKNVTLVTLGEKRTAAILANCERRGALSIANQAIAEIGAGRLHDSSGHDCPAATLSIGVATMSLVPRNFDPERLIESAVRCLSAARVCGISTVKSIEV